MLSNCLLILNHKYSKPLVPPLQVQYSTSNKAYLYDVLSLVIKKLFANSAMNFADCGGEMAGQEYKRHLLNTLCSSRYMYCINTFLNSNQVDCVLSCKPVKFEHSLFFAEPLLTPAVGNWEEKEALYKSLQAQSLGLSVWRKPVFAVQALFFVGKPMVKAGFYLKVVFPPHNLGLIWISHSL